jgi:hypothetical protein
MNDFLQLDWLKPAVIGFTLNVVGLFFLASAISFKKPRREIEEILGVERPRSLSAVRDHLVNQVQTYIGFVFLVAGHVLLMGSELQASGAEDPNLVVIVLVLLLSTVATMAVLKLVQLLFARRNFRRLLGEVLRESSFALEKDQKMAVQIGELLQIPKNRDQSVPEYIEEVRRTLGLAEGPASIARSSSLRRAPKAEHPRV